MKRLLWMVSRFFGPSVSTRAKKEGGFLKNQTTRSGLPRIYVDPLKAVSIKDNPSKNYVTEFKNSCDYTEIIFGDKKRHHQITTDPNGKIVAYLRDVSPKFAQRFANLLDEHIKGFGAPSVNLPVDTR